MAHIKYYFDWLFKDLRGRNGKYIIAEVPNVPQVIFIISIILAVIVYPGFFQKLFAVVAYISLSYWAYLEITSGHSRFRKLLGIMAIAAVAAALIMRLGF